MPVASSSVCVFPYRTRLSRSSSSMKLTALPEAV